MKMVRAEFGFPLVHVPRMSEKELGGGTLLDIGIYCLQFICMVYDGEKPESIQAKGICLESGNKELTCLLKLCHFTNARGSVSFAVMHLM